MEFVSGKDSILDLENSELQSFLQVKSLELVNIEVQNPLNAKEVEDYSKLISSLLRLTNKVTEEVQVLLNCCFVDILRIVAPNEILNKNQMNSVFKSINKSIPLLKNPEKPEYHQIIHVLQVIELTSIAALAIKHELYLTLVSFIENCLESVVVNCCLATEDLIENNIRIIFEELPELNEVFLFSVLVSLKKEYKNTPRARISESLLSKKIAPLRNTVTALITSQFSGKPSKPSCPQLTSDRFYLAVKLYKLNHDYLVDLFRILTSSIQKKKTDQSTAKMISRIACCKKSSLESTNSHLFSEFLKFLDSENEKIRILILKGLPKFFKNHKIKSQVCEKVLININTRVKDLNEKVRIVAIQTLMKISSFMILPKNTLNDISDRIKDVKKPVRKAAIEVIIKIFETVWIRKKIQGLESPDYFSNIIEKIFQFLQNFSDIDDQVFTIFNLQELFIRAVGAERHSLTFAFIYQALSKESREILENLIKTSQFWNRKLTSTLYEISESLESLEPLQSFCGNMKGSILVQSFKPRLKTNQGELFDLLKDKELQILLKSSLEISETSQLFEIFERIQEKAKNYSKGFMILRARCFNLILRDEHVPFLVRRVEVLPLLARTHFSALSPFIPKIAEYLHQQEARPLVFEVLAEVDLVKFKLEDLMVKEILEIYKNLQVSEAWAVRSTLKNMGQDFIENFSRDLLASQTENHEKTVIELLFLKKIIKFWPTVVESIVDDVKGFAMRVCENKESACKEKCLAVVLLHSLVKYCGKLTEVIFPYIRNIGFNLSGFYRKRVKTELNLSQDDEKTLRIRCFKSIFTLFSMPDMKYLLDSSTLACLGSAVMSSYTSEISKLVINSFYKSSNLLTPLLAILGLLLATSESKPASQALTQVLVKMKQDSLEKEVKEKVLRTQPETYTSYLLFVIAKCKVPDKIAKIVLAGYFKCLTACERLDAKYLSNLMRIMKKYRINSQEIRCDFQDDGDRVVELGNVCDEMNSLIAGCFFDEDLTENVKDILIPPSLFEKIEDLQSPDQGTGNRVDSSLRKRGVQSSSKKKVFNMFT